jgi:hypothetical protein
MHKIDYHPGQMEVAAKMECILEISSSMKAGGELVAVK